MELNNSQKMGLVFAGLFAVVVLVMSTMVFQFWNLIREDVFEEVLILNNDNGRCYVETIDSIPKIIDNCNLQPGDKAKIKYGKGLAWATVIEA